MHHNLRKAANFVHGFPFVAVSIGFTLAKVPTVGIVYNPFLNQMYTGVRGAGSSLNGVKLPIRAHPPPLEGLGGCLIAVEWGSDRSEDSPSNAAAWYIPCDRLVLQR